jgi:5-methyltetrahydrofolate--homocysteine methyltransferase
MDMGIVNAGMIDVYEDIPKDLLKLVEDILLNRSEDATEKLVAFAENVKSKVPEKSKESEWRKKSLEERISHALVKGLVEFIDEDVEAARKKFGKALKVIEGPLMAGMNKVGELFGQGKMFLPQVVKSARVMKKAVDVLAPYVKAEKKHGDSSYFAGKILMATVKGDVHDIGKNIVGVVLACNNFEIVDLGVMVTCENILKAARRKKVDIICLSGLITPSLDEMVHVAREMERQGFDIPLLIGGATTSKEHCALKIDPAYHGLVGHVKDASLSVSISRDLMKPETKSRIVNDTKDEYKKLREKYAQKQKAQQILSLDEARRRRFSIDWKSTNITKPSFLGRKVFKSFSLDEIKDKIDWSSFFTTWELKGRYPEILDDPNLGREANKIFNDAKEILSEIIEKNLLTANAVLGFFPANSVGDDIEVYKDDSRRKVLTTFYSLRQQILQNDDYCYALSDFVAPKDTGVKDYMGFFALTTGIGVKELIAKLKKEGDDYKAIMIESLADRLAEAFSELMHEKARKSLWGYIPEENLTKEEEFKCKYQGIRPALGYPIFPDHSQKDILFKLLNVKKNTCIELTENYGMIPAATVCGFYIAHPQSRYFWLGKIGKDQMMDLAGRSSKKLKEIEKWLSPYLGY